MLFLFTSRAVNLPKKYFFRSLFEYSKPSPACLNCHRVLAENRYQVFCWMQPPPTEVFRLLGQDMTGNYFYAVGSSFTFGSIQLAKRFARTPVSHAHQLKD